MADPSERILMISLHGYVSGRAELGRPDTGGQVVYVLKLAEGLARMGHAVDIYTRRFEDQPEVEILGERLRIVRVPCGGPALIRKEWMVDVVPEWVARTEARIRREGSAYALVNSHYWDAGLAGRDLARRLGIPHIHTPHSIGSWKRASLDGEEADLERQYNFRRRIRAERDIYHAADALVATTPQQRDILTREPYAVGPERIHVLPPGFDDTRFSPVSRTVRQDLKAGMGLAAPLVLALGRVAENKGYDLMLRAMPTVIDREPEARLLLAAGSSDPTAGEREQIGALRRLASELGVIDQVTFRDHVPDEQLADVYRAADVFALSSRYEPFGMTAVEAMACGTPTVVTTQGGLWEMLTWGVDALYADPLDPPAFGHAIATLLQHPEIADRLGRGGAERARADFTWSGIARRFARLIDGLSRLESVAASALAAGSAAAGHERAVGTRRSGWVPTT